VSATSIPKHIAIIMDGNGRWARKRGLPRSVGHRNGVKTVRTCIEYCARQGVEVLTVFAFSSENWKRPAEEVGLLMSLFFEALDREIAELHRNNVCVRFIGDRQQLSSALRERIEAAETKTQSNSGLKLVVAVAYGGRWDIAQATQKLAEECVLGTMAVDAIDDNAIEQHLSLSGLPEPDLFIRTGGERRISNFLLWNLAYTELYFTDVLWPDFDTAELNNAVVFFAGRERRFGLTSAQLNQRADEQTGAS
jgi:undecaprenyl diphosphate synthase